MKMPKALSKIALCMFIFLTTEVRANLVFEKYIIEEALDAFTPAYSFAFKFKNEGNFPITITEIASSCDCTVAKSDKKVFQPGENGEIRGSFNIGNRIGFHEKQIRLSCDDINDPQIDLTLKLTIPMPLSIKPKLVFWKLEDELKIKTIVIKKMPNIELEFKKIESKDFKVTVECNPKNKNETILKIAPLHTDKPARLNIEFFAGHSKNSGKKYSIYAIIK